MRKFTNFLFALTVGIGTANAGVVSQPTAQTVAGNFYAQTFGAAPHTISLAYSENDANGQVAYYVFNINAKDGFVIVSAEDAERPIIGYSNRGQYVVPKTLNNVGFWMKKRVAEVSAVRTSGVAATSDISEEWTAYINNTVPNFVSTHRPHRVTGSPFPSSTAYLVQSTWDQPAPYNDDCPGGSVTGCVATAMSQIMRFWSYPPSGSGSSSYCDCTSDGFTENYGTLSATYTHPYRWSNMPLTSPSASDTDLARLLSDAGISVQMDYSPSGSGAYVITLDDASACAQISYVKYFNYLATIIDGQDMNSNATTWQDTLEKELNHSRPIQYVGDDPSAGGHTWVCDGYNSSNDFHMNWGWSGSDDGWYAISNLAPTGSGYDFSQNNEALVGIMPPGLQANFTVSPSTACAGATVTFTDETTGQSTPNSWAWKFGDGGTSTAQNPTHTYATAGTYNVTEIVGDASGGKDTVIKNACVTIEPNPGAALPLSQGFESSSSIPTGWSINNPDGHTTVWAVTNQCSGFGKSTQCMFYNNCSGGIAGNYDQVYTPTYNFTGDVSPEMYFDVAYEPEDNASNVSSYAGVYYSDTLAVYYSTDCGNTWTNVYLKGGATLCTTAGTQGGGTDAGTGEFCFVPATTHWRTDTIKLSAITGKTDVMFSFENRSGNGCNLYIDNINIPASPTGISTIQPMGQVNVYPNPNSGTFTVEFNNVQNKQQLTIYNMLGQNVYSTVVGEGKTEVNFTQTPGIYFYRILSLEGKTLSEGKMIVK